MAETLSSNGRWHTSDRRPHDNLENFHLSRLDTNWRVHVCRKKHNFVLFLCSFLVTDVYHSWGVIVVTESHCLRLKSSITKENGEMKALQGPRKIAATDIMKSNVKLKESCVVTAWIHEKAIKIFFMHQNDHVAENAFTFIPTPHEMQMPIWQSKLTQIGKNSKICTCDIWINEKNCNCESTKKRETPLFHIDGHVSSQECRVRTKAPKIAKRRVVLQCDTAKMEDTPKWFKFQRQSAHTYGYVSRDISGPNHDQTLKISWTHPLAAALVVGRKQFKKKMISTGNSKLGMFVCSSEVKNVLLNTRGWHQHGWKKGEYSPTLMKSTQHKEFCSNHEFLQQ